MSPVATFSDFELQTIIAPVLAAKYDELRAPLTGGSAEKCGTSQMLRGAFH
jgi:hypothetical protein